jgi:4-amino-4-deoxy-L-arabinose transferase-like glycosyltransferase
MTPGRRWLVASLALVVLGLTFGISGYPLLEPDEGRNAEIAREMAASNDYAIPRLNGLPYLDKPVLYFSVGAALMEVLGPTELAARLPSVLFTLATLALVFWFGRLVLGPVGGVVAAVATGAAPLTLAFARTVIFDSALTFFVTLSIVAFYVAAEGPGNAPPDHTEHRGWWTSLGWAGLALAVLTKGPIGLGLPLMVIVPYLGWRRRWRALWDPVAVLLFVAILLPWLFAMSREVPDFLEYALVTETFKRLATDELQRTGPFWYFIPIIVAGSLPWSLVAALGWKRGRGATGTVRSGDHRLVLFLLWIVIPLVFFSLSQSKRPHYVLPLIPAIGLLVGLLWNDGRAHGARGGGVALAVCGLVILLAPTIVGALLDVESAVARAIPRTAWSLGAVCMLAGTATFFVAGRREVALFALCLPVAAIPFVSANLMSAIGADRSSRDVAAAIERTMTDRTEIVAIQTYPLSLPFYLRRQFLVATTDGSELTSNYLIRTYPRWAGMLDSPFRPQDWWMDALADCRRPRVFLVRNDDARTRGMLAGRLPLIGSNRKVAAYGPCGASDLAARPVVSRAAPD